MCSRKVLPSTLNVSEYTVDASQSRSRWVAHAADIFQTNRFVILDNFFLVPECLSISSIFEGHPSPAPPHPSSANKHDSSCMQGSEVEHVCNHGMDACMQHQRDVAVLSDLHRKVNNHFVTEMLVKDAGRFGNRSGRENLGRYTIGDWVTEPAFNMINSKTDNTDGDLGDAYLQVFARFIERGGPELLQAIGGDYKLSSAGAQIVLGESQRQMEQSRAMGRKNERQKHGTKKGRKSSKQWRPVRRLQSDFQTLHMDLNDRYVPDVGDLRAHKHPPMLQFHITTQEINEQNGAMRIRPNSPQRDAIYELSTAQKYYDNQRQVDVEPYEEKRSQLAPLKLGSAVLRDVQLWHGGCPNHDQTKPARIWPFFSFYSKEFLDALVTEHRSGRLDIPLVQSKLLQPWRFSRADFLCLLKKKLCGSQCALDRAEELISNLLFLEASPYRRWPVELIRLTLDKHFDIQQECPTDTSSIKRTIIATLGQDLERHDDYWDVRSKISRNYWLLSEGKSAAEYDSWCENVNTVEEKLFLMGHASGSIG